MVLFPTPQEQSTRVSQLRRHMGQTDTVRISSRMDKVTLPEPNSGSLEARSRSTLIKPHSRQLLFCPILSTAPIPYSRSPKSLLRLIPRQDRHNLLLFRPQDILTTLCGCLLGAMNNDLVKSLYLFDGSRRGCGREKEGSASKGVAKSRDAKES